MFFIRAQTLRFLNSCQSTCDADCIRAVRQPLHRCQTQAPPARYRRIGPQDSPARHSAAAHLFGQSALSVGACGHGSERRVIGPVLPSPDLGPKQLDQRLGITVPGHNLRSPFARCDLVCQTVEALVFVDPQSGWEASDDVEQATVVGASKRRDIGQGSFGPSPPIQKPIGGLGDKAGIPLRKNRGCHHPCPVPVTLQPSSGPARFCQTITSEEGDERRSRCIDADIAGRTDQKRLVYGDQPDAIKERSQHFADVPSPGIHYNDLGRFALVDHRGDCGGQGVLRAKANYDDGKVGRLYPVAFLAAPPP